MDLSTIAVKVRAALQSAGTTIPSRKTQDLLFDLYPFMDDTTGPEVKEMLRLTLKRDWFKSIEVELLLTRIEASANN